MSRKTVVNQTNLKKAEAITLSRGSHPTIEDGACVMELVSFIANEPWSDSPKCTSQVLAAFARRFNDALDDEGRQRLKPYLKKLVGTAGTKAQDSRRAWLATDWLIRHETPAWLELAGLKDHADALRNLSSIHDLVSCKASRDKLSAARSAADSAARSAADSAADSVARSAADSVAWSAADSAARSAARSAAWSAADSVARSAAWSAARSAADSVADSAADSAADSVARSAADSVAWSAAWSAARSVAWSAADSVARSAAWSAADSAAWSVAYSAAYSALAPTIKSLQESGFELLDRMIACK